MALPGDQNVLESGARQRGILRSSSRTDSAPDLPGWLVAWPAAVDAHVEVRHWAGRRVQFGRIVGGALDLRRQLTAEDLPAPLAAVMVVHAGVVSLRDGQRALMRADAGTATLRRLDQPLDVALSADADLSVALVPLALLESRGIEIRGVDGATWQAGVIEESAVQLATSGAGAASHGSAVIESAVPELIVGALADQDTPVDDAASRARARAVALIDERYADPTLDADVVAKSLGVSRRYLYSLFEGRTLSVAALIRHRRVSHAQSLLVGDAGLSLRQVAQRSGLGSEDRLLRTFKTVLNISPSAYRRAEAGRQSA